MYLERQPNFTIGPENDENENASLIQAATASRSARRKQKTAQSTAQTANNLVPLEMDGGSVARIAAKLRRAPYAPLFPPLFGSSVFQNARVLVTEALFAIARYEFEDRTFHPYTSKFDYWLEGKARFSPAEVRGYHLFNDQHRADCAACHLDRPRRDRLPPLFTDHQFEALGVPRNTTLSANSDSRYFDLGICGPIRTDMRSQTQYCGMFATPTLRNVATRHVFFHNGVYHSLRQVLDFYNFRVVDPQRIYPRRLDGTLYEFNDIPPRYRTNVDVADPPFDRAPGERPPMSAQDEEDIIAFLETLTDGYRPRP